MRRKKEDRKLCKHCGQKRAVFHYRGRVKADADHDLCPRCYRAQLNSFYAAQLALVEAA